MLFFGYFEIVSNHTFVNVWGLCPQTPASGIYFCHNYKRFSTPNFQTLPPPMEWNGKVYQFQCLPFGLTSAPRVFSKVMKPVVGTLRYMGIRLIIYLDNILMLHQVKEELIQAIPLICQFFETLGLVINQKKSILIPQQRIEFLGFLVDATTLHLVFPAEKLSTAGTTPSLSTNCLSERISEVCWEDLSITEGDMAGPSSLQSTTVFDKLCSTDRPVPTGGFGCEIQYQLETNQRGRGGPDMVEFPGQKDSLAIPTMPQTTKYDNRVRCFQYGVGSSARRAADRGKVVHGGSFTSHKLLAAFLALQCFAKHGHNATILMRLDSVTAVTYINKLGGTHSLPLCQLALTIWNWFIQREIFLLAEHLPGKDNVIADQESRSMKDRCDWMLNPLVFKQIHLQMGPLEVDLFASRLTKQLPIFYSWRPDPEAQGTDAFRQDWSQMRGFANPPWCLIVCCLSQVKRQVARMVMVTLLWTSQPWYPTILGMLEDFPRILPAQDDLVILQTEQAFIMNQGVPVLVAWPISENPLHQEEFLQRLQISCYHPGDQKLSQTTTCCLQNGLAGVYKGIGIPLRDL